MDIDYQANDYHCLGVVATADNHPGLGDVITVKSRSMLVALTDRYDCAAQPNKLKLYTNEDLHASTLSCITLKRDSG
jgi:hypothetical protein